jgi:hypothetical protein
VEVPLQEALFADRREAYPRYELGRFKNLVALRMNVICSSEMSLLAGATRYKVPKDIHQRRDVFVVRLRLVNILQRFDSELYPLERRK